jgi:hypothetical protein
MDLGAYFITLQYTLMGATFIALMLIFMYAYYGKDEEEQTTQVNRLFLTTNSFYCAYSKPETTLHLQ